MKPTTNGRRKARIRKPPVLFSQTQALLKKIRSRMGIPVVTYWNSSRGSVCNNDVSAFYEILTRLGKQKKLALFLKSDGGSATTSLRIVHLIRNFASHVTALVPQECQSAATMVVLGADRIRMGPMAYLGAVDTSLTHQLSPTDQSNDLVSVSNDELERLVRLWRASSGKGSNPYPDLFQHIHPLVIGAVDRASSLSIKLCNEILSYHMNDSRKASRISRHLATAYPSHGYPITSREAKRIGLNVDALDTEVNDLLIELNAVYSEMGQKALTDYDEENYHDNEILNILETAGEQLFYQTEKDWHYRKEERRWVPLNDRSGWHRVELKGKRAVRSPFHIR